MKVLLASVVVEPLIIGLEPEIDIDVNPVNGKRRFVVELHWSTASFLISTGFTQWRFLQAAKSRFLH
jgi:hypothetical protein